MDSIDKLVHDCTMDYFDSLTAVNENRDPFARPDTGLEEVYRIRREILAQPTAGRSLSWWQGRRRALELSRETEQLYLACLATQPKPLAYANLVEAIKLREQVQGMDTRDRPLSWWRTRRETLRDLDDAIDSYLRQVRDE